MKSLKKGKNFRILVTPDHATPISKRTHTRDAICFGIYGKDIIAGGFLNYSEKQAQKSDLYFENGYELMDYLIKGEK